MSAKLDVNPATETSQAAKQSQTARPNVALHLGQHRLVHLDDLAQQRHQTRHPLRRSSLACTLGEVGTGTERVGRVGQHDGADGVVGLDVAKMPGEFSDQPGTQRIAVLRRIQRERGNQVGVVTTHERRLG